MVTDTRQNIYDKFIKFRLEDVRIICIETSYAKLYFHNFKLFQLIFSFLLTLTLNKMYTYYFSDCFVVSKF